MGEQESTQNQTDRPQDVPAAKDKDTATADHLSTTTGNPYLAAPDAYVQLYAIVAGLWDSECDRYWARNNIFLILQGALLAGFTSASSDVFLRLSMASLGLVLCVIWFGISVQGAHYVARWRPALEELEEHLPAKPLHLVKSDSVVFRKEKNSLLEFFAMPIKALRRGGSTRFMHYAILIIALSWIVLAALSSIFLLPSEPEVIYV